MAPKPNANATKLAAVLGYFHQSGVAHSIKDLEKALPRAASISSMQVKDYLQTLTDESKVHVEKIGSGNWYWAFAGEERQTKQAAVDKALEEQERLEAAVDEAQGKLAAVGQQLEDEDASEREAVTRLDEALTAKVAALKAELVRYADSDPVEIARRRAAVQKDQQRAESFTEQITAMETYLKRELGVDRETLAEMQRDLYGAEWDEEEAGLVELRDDWTTCGS